MKRNNITRNSIYRGDCLEVMQDIEDKSIDAIICDLPYGTTACKWDTIIPFEPLWEAYERIIKDNGAIVLTASQPFTSALVMSNIKMFKYELIWEKPQGTVPMNAPYQPMKAHEDILVFSKMASSYSKKGNMNYFPVMEEGKPYKSTQGKMGKMVFHSNINVDYVTINKGERFPKSVLKVNSERGLHPTQKPIALMEYLIKTYTNEGELVLDNCMGSGTTCVAAKNTGRDYIGIEQDAQYFEIAKKRIEGNGR